MEWVERIDRKLRSLCTNIACIVYIRRTCLLSHCMSTQTRTRAIEHHYTGEGAARGGWCIRTKAKKQDFSRHALFSQSICGIFLLLASRIHHRRTAPLLLLAANFGRVNLTFVGSEQEQRGVRHLKRTLWKGEFFN